MRRLGLKTGVDFTHFGLESGMKGTTDCINAFVVSIPKIRERKMALFFWSKIGTGFGGPGGTPQPTIPWSTLPPLSGH